MLNRALPVQTTANAKVGLQPSGNLKKAIECWSFSYGKLPLAAGALDTIY